MKLTRHSDLSLAYVLSTESSPDAAAPLVLVMHGRGADANDLADIAPMLDAGGCRFVFPNAPRAFEPYPGMTFGRSWFDGWPPQGSSFAESRALVARFIEELLDRYPTPAGTLVVSGFSQGGMMALDTGLRIEQPVAGVVCMSGALNENDPPPLRDHRHRPVLLVHGSEDEMIPVLAARRTRLLLEESGIDPEYHEFPMGHQVSPESLATVAAFIRRVVS